MEETLSHDRQEALESLGFNVRTGDNYKRILLKTPDVVSDEKIRQILRKFGDVASYFGESSEARRERLFHLISEKNMTLREFFRETGINLKRRNDMNELFLSTFANVLDEYSSKAQKERNGKLQVHIEKLRSLTTRKFREIRRTQIRNCARSVTGTCSTLSSLTPGATPRCSVFCQSFLKPQCISAIGHGNGNLSLVDLTSMTQQLELRAAHSSRINALSYGAEQQFLASCSGDGELKLWKMISSEKNYVRPIATIKVAEESVVDCSLLIGSTNLVCAGAGDTIYLYDINRSVGVSQDAVSTHVGSLQAASGSPVKCLTQHVDGCLLLSGNEAGSVSVWDLRTAKMIAAWKAHDGRALALTCANDGIRIATGGDDHMIHVWNLRAAPSQSAPTANLCNSIRSTQHRALWGSLAGHRGSITALHFPDAQTCEADLSSAESWLLSSSCDGTVKIWDASLLRSSVASSDAMRKCSSGYENLRTLHGHSNRIVSVYSVNQVVSPDRVSAQNIETTDMTIVSVGADRSVRTWNATRSCQNHLAEIQCSFDHTKETEPVVEEDEEDELTTFLNEF